MKNKICPDCGYSEIPKKALWMHILFGAKLYCGKCGSRLKTKVGIITSFLSGALSQFVVLAAIFIGLYFRSWLIFSLMFISAIALEVAVYNFGTLTRVGVKRFSLKNDL